MYFPAFKLNTERYSVSLRIQFECGKIRTRKTPNTGTFYAVQSSPAGNYILKVNNRNTRTNIFNVNNRRSGVFIVNFEHISHFVLLLLLSTLNDHIRCLICRTLTKNLRQNLQSIGLQIKAQTFGQISRFSA